MRRLFQQVATGVLIVRHEGVLRLWAGWRPAVARAMCYGGENNWPGCWVQGGATAHGISPNHMVLMKTRMGVWCSRSNRKGAQSAAVHSCAGRGRRG
jgi:hypothetical protein